MCCMDFGVVSLHIISESKKKILVVACCKKRLRMHYIIIIHTYTSTRSYTIYTRTSALVDDQSLCLSFCFFCQYHVWCSVLVYMLCFSLFSHLFLFCIFTKFLWNASAQRWINLWNTQQYNSYRQSMHRVRAMHA